MLDPDPANLYWPGHEGETINTEWAGISGGPVYRVIDAIAGKELLARVEVIGFIYQRWQGIMLARPSTLVNADGTIRP